MASVKRHHSNTNNSNLLNRLRKSKRARTQPDRFTQLTPIEELVKNIKKDNISIKEPYLYNIKSYLEKNKSITRDIVYLNPEFTRTFSGYKRRDNFEYYGDVLLTKASESNSKIKFKVLDGKMDLVREHEWIYLFTVDDRVVKIGGTRLSLLDRFHGYQCGNVSCQGTNKKIHDTFYFYLLLGCKIKFYGIKLSSGDYISRILDYDIRIRQQIYHVYESVYIYDYLKQYRFKPILSQFADPKYANLIHFSKKPFEGLKIKLPKRKTFKTPFKQIGSKYNNNNIEHIIPHIIIAPSRQNSVSELNKTIPPPAFELTVENNTRANQMAAAANHAPELATLPEASTLTQSQQLNNRQNMNVDGNGNLVSNVRNNTNASTQLGVFPTTPLSSQF